MNASLMHCFVMLMTYVFAKKLDYLLAPLDWLIRLSRQISYGLMLNVYVTVEDCSLARSASVYEHSRDWKNLLCKYWWIKETN